MTTIGVIRNGVFCLVEDAPMRANQRYDAGPAVHRDIAAYKSPLGNGVIDGRRAQRDDLARGGCRLADRSEFPDFPKGGAFENRRFVEKHSVPTDKPLERRLNTDRARGGRYAD